MNKIVFTLLTAAVISSCTTLKRTQVPESPARPKSSPKVSVDIAPQKSPKVSKAVWHLIDPLGLELVVTSATTQESERILIDKTLSQVELPEGDWEITGFTIEGKNFELIDTSKHFNFKIKPAKPSYAGSIIVQCPTIGNKHLSAMKKMSFFNRLSFKSGINLCEMVIGNEFKTVERVWNKLAGRKESKLIMGF